MPLAFIKTFFSSQSRMLSPLFAFFAFYELFFGKARTLFRFKNLEPYHYALLLTGGTGFMTSIAGYKYVMVHVFWFILLMPFFALLCAQFISEFKSKNYELNPLAPSAIALGLALLVLYPYGIYQSNLIHDALNSAILALGVLVFLFKRYNLNSKSLLILLSATAFANFSQVLNYRNEPDTEHSFCQQALAEFLTTGQPVNTNIRRSLTKDRLYCRGIPINYQEN